MPTVAYKKAMHVVQPARLALSTWLTGSAATEDVPGFGTKADGEALMQLDARMTLLAGEAVTMFWHGTRGRPAAHALHTLDNGTFTLDNGVPTSAYGPLPHKFMQC